MHDSPSIVVRAVDAQAVIDLRHRILRTGMSREAAIFEGDHESTTLHLAAFDAWDALVGCVTLVHRPWQAQPAWQLRGMAVDDSLQRTGIGARLLAEVDEQVLADARARLLWCNARKHAVGFYERHGWQLASPEFEIPTAGPHHKMIKHL